MAIKATGITKKFKNYVALDDVSIQVDSGEFLALLGPSGSGKTTLLRIIAGLEHPDSGVVKFQEEDIHRTPLQQRGVGFVFQHYALFKHMSVYENISFGLQVKPKQYRDPPQVIQEKVYELLKLVQLEGLQDKYPSQLSGGQKQRVALARVLAVNPQVMLLDEPFGSLDAKIRQGLRSWLRRLHDEMKITTIFVTHDQEEAMEVADRVAIMDKAKIVQIGTPEEIWNRPVNAFVYDFLGNYNVFYGTVSPTGAVELIEEAGGGAPSGSVHKIFSRPYQTELCPLNARSHSALQAKITHINPASPLLKIEAVRSNGQTLKIELSKDQAEEWMLKKGMDVWVRPKEFRIFPDQGGAT